MAKTVWYLVDNQEHMAYVHRFWKESPDFFHPIDLPNVLPSLGTSVLVKRSLIKTPDSYLRIERGIVSNGQRWQDCISVCDNLCLDSHIGWGARDDETLQANCNRVFPRIPRFPIAQ